MLYSRQSVPLHASGVCGKPDTHPYTKLIIFLSKQKADLSNYTIKSIEIHSTMIVLFYVNDMARISFMVWQPAVDLHFSVCSSILCTSSLAPRSECPFDVGLELTWFIVRAPPFLGRASVTSGFRLKANKLLQSRRSWRVPCWYHWPAHPDIRSSDDGSHEMWM